MAAVIGIGLRALGTFGRLGGGVGRVGRRGFSVRVVDQTGYERYLKREERQIRRRMTIQLRKAAKHARDNVKRSARSNVKRRTGALHRGASFRVNARGLKRAGDLTKSFQRRAKGATVNAAIFMRVAKKNRSGLYAPGLEAGAEVQRKQATVRRKGSDKTFVRRAHRAKMPRQAFFRRGIDRSASGVFRILGKSFRVA